MFEFEFMRRTMLVGALLGVMIPLIGIIMVNRKTSMMGDALSHTALAGVAFGLILGFDPMIGAAIICIIAAFVIEAIRKRFPQYGDMATAVIMSTGLGLAAILSDFTPGGNSLESYLFGSISAASPFDVALISIIFVVVVVTSILNYSGLLYISINPNLARLGGVNTKLVNNIFTLFSALIIAISCKIVGVLLVASLLVLPVATALLVARSYKQIYFFSICLGLAYMLVGLTLSWHLDIKPGGAIIILAVSGLIIFSLISQFRKTRNKLNEEALQA